MLLLFFVRFHNVLVGFLIIFCQNHNKSYFAHIVTIETNGSAKNMEKIDESKLWCWFTEVSEHKCIEFVQKKRIPLLSLSLYKAGSDAENLLNVWAHVKRPLSYNFFMSSMIRHEFDLISIFFLCVLRFE